MPQDERGRPEPPTPVSSLSPEPSLAYRWECWRRLWAALLAPPKPEQESAAGDEPATRGEAA